MHLNDNRHIWRTLESISLHSAKLYKVATTVATYTALYGNRHIHLFDYAALDYPLTTHCVIQYVIVMTGIYTKLTRAVLTTKTRVTHVVNTVLGYWTIPLDIPNHALGVNVPQVVNKFSVTISGYQDIKHLTTTPHSRQTNVQIGRCDMPNFTSLRYNIADNKRDWEEFL